MMDQAMMLLMCELHLDNAEEDPACLEFARQALWAYHSWRGRIGFHPDLDHQAGDVLFRVLRELYLSLGGSSDVPRL